MRLTLQRAFSTVQLDTQRQPELTGYMLNPSDKSKTSAIELNSEARPAQ
jgi:hypothetical protein